MFSLRPSGGYGYHICRALTVSRISSVQIARGMSDLVTGKKAAAIKAVDDYVKVCSMNSSMYYDPSSSH